MRTLKGKRVDKGLTQEEMAIKLGVTTKTYNRKELGIADFNLTELKEISEILGMSLTEFNIIFLNNKLPNG